MQLLPNNRHNMVIFPLLYALLCKDRLQRMQMHSSGIEEDGIAIVDATGDEHID